MGGGEAVLAVDAVVADGVAMNVDDLDGPLFCFAQRSRAGHDSCEDGLEPTSATTAKCAGQKFTRRAPSPREQARASEAEPPLS